MKKLMTPTSAYPAGAHGTALVPAASRWQVAVVETRRLRALVVAGIEVRGGGELCPQVGIQDAARDTLFAFPLSGTAVSGESPV